LRVPALTAEHIPAADLHIATFWTTVPAAAAMASGQAVHFCQGFEGALDHNRDQHAEIFEAYSTPLPVWVVSPHLAALNRERFGRACKLVTPALEGFWQPAKRPGPARRPRVLVPHPFEFYMKGVDTALQAVAELRERGLELQLIRLSQWPLGEAERALLEPDEFHHHLQPTAVAELLAGCDLLLAPAWECEGFGLAVLEAMACGVPVVASRIPSHESFAAHAAALVAVADAGAYARAAEAILTDPERWQEMRQRGIESASRFSEDAVMPILDDAVRWAVSGEWRAQD
jgi:glycosyltransferase involved in cell wall biosynthesis